MSDDSFLHVRDFNGGYLVTRETLSQEVPSDPQEALDRILTTQCGPTEGFFTSADDADEFVEDCYEEADNEQRPFEYGPSSSNNPYKF